MARINNLLNRLKTRIRSPTLSLEEVERLLGQKLPKLKISLGSFVLIAAILAYTIVFSSFTILRHHNFQSSGWDLGIYMQSLYTASFYGQPLRYTIEQFTFNPYGSFFGVHFSPLVLLLVPVYRLAPFAETLLILQSFIIALGSYGVYLISNFIHANRFVSLSLAMAYLLCTPLQAVNWFDFHIQAFIPLLFLMMFYFCVKKQFTISFAFFLLTLSTIEIMPVLLFAFGVYCLVSNRNERKGLLFGGIVIGISILWFLLGAFVKASLNPMYESTFGAWSIWGSSYTEILASVATRPVDMLAYFFTVFPLEKGLYFLWLMAPVLFLPLFARKEFVLLVMPWIAMVFLSTYVGYFTNQYAAFVVPQLFIATIFGLRDLSKSVEHINFRRSLVMRYSKWVLWAAVASFILMGPFSIVGQTRSIYIHGLPQDTLNKQALREALQLVPENATVYTSYQIEPHLANRLAIYVNSVPETPPDYIVIDIRLPDSSTSLGGFGGAAILGADQLLKRYNYALIFSNDGILIYRINTGNSSNSETITLSFNFKDLTLDAGVIREDSSSRAGSILTHRPEDDINRFWHGPYVALPSGVYEIAYRLKSGQTGSGHLFTLDVTSELGETLLARKYMYDHDLEPNVWKSVTLQFSTELARTFVEFRCTFASNSTTQSLDFIELTRLSPSAGTTFGSTSYNYKDMSVITGNSTRAGTIFQRKDSLVPFSFGVYARVPPGTYTIGFWLRLDDLAQGQVFSITAEGFDNVSLASMEIVAADFGGKEQWEYFSFTLAATNTTLAVEIKGFGNVDTSFSFSYLEIENRES